jgi:chromosomal replication initiation ATPase DnaA
MQLVMPFAPPTSYEPADFIRGQANAAALALVEQWPDWAYSIALVHGPKGCGKTHLAHAFAARSHATFLGAERIGSRPADQLLVGNHAWVIDGIEAVTDAPALAQLINHARARGDYVLMTATNSAAELPFTLPDLRTTASIQSHPANRANMARSINSFKGEPNIAR